MMKQIIIGISTLTAVAFLGMSVVTTYQIFNILISGDDAIRGELWILLILCFTGGVILLSIAWGIAELSDSRRARQLATSSRVEDETEAE